MRRWTKRILVGIAVILFAVILFCSGGLMLYKGTPDWYAVKLAPEKAAEAARNAESKLALTQNWAVTINGDAVRASRAQQSGKSTPATRATDDYDIRFSQDELNALFDKWSTLYGWQSKYGQWIDEPRIVLKPDTLILAADVKNLGTIVSFHFTPRLDEQGRLHLDLARVMGGRLPLPSAVWDSYKQKLVASLNKWIPIWKQQAKFDQEGAANSQAMFATLGTLVLHAANYQPGKPIIFLPLVENSHAVPVRITQLAIDDDSIDLKVRKLTPAETVALEASLRTNVSSR